MRRSLILVVVALSLASTPAQPVRADNDAAQALLLLGIIGGVAAASNHNRNKARAQQQQQQPPRAPAPRKPARPAAEVQADKNMQQALNFFGFGAGAVDGDPGPQTRTAASSFQSAMNWPVTGTLPADQRQVLSEAWNWAVSNPQQAMQVAAASPLGQRGVPSAYRDMRMGRPVAGLAPPAAPTPPPVAPQPPPANQIALLPSLPTAPSRSMADLCNQTANFSGANGGQQTPTNLTDPTLALNEQFCLARGFATSDAKQIADSNSYSQEQIASVCSSVQAVLATGAEGFGSKSPADVISAMQGSISANNLPADRLEAAARMCLGEAYRTDDAGMANVMAIALAAAGRRAYAEVVGHHLREGLGTTANPSASRPWVKMALDAVAAGEAPAFLPGQAPQRGAILSAANAVN